jgi:NAD(P)H-quinone oxidoreductase subunit 5
MLNRFFVRPFLSVFRWCDRMERGWTDLLTGSASRESDLLTTATHTTAEDDG